MPQSSSSLSSYSQGQPAALVMALCVLSKPDTRGPGLVKGLQ